METLEKTNISDDKVKSLADKTSVMDGNEAAAYIAYKLSEVCAIYPITPSSPMGEYCDEWSSTGEKNIFGGVPHIIEMQSEAGAAGAIHGALQGGALASTFTCSQGLLLMIPNMFKIAGELTPCVFYIAARTISTHALSIFGDHSDVMAVRSTGFSMLFGSTAQEAMDMALIANATTLSSHVPFLNIFDGFRTSHELSKVKVISDDIINAMINMDDVRAHRNRSLSPEHPFIRGTAQNPDVFFQNREAANQYYLKVPEITKNYMAKFAELTGRKYKLFSYHGHPEAEQVIVIMGSGAGAVREAVDYLNAKVEKVGFINIHLYRPFSINDFVSEIPETVKQIVVLDRCKEPGSSGEPLYLDVVNALNESPMKNHPRIIGGRYGLASKEFTPAMVVAVFDECKKTQPKNHFSVGIEDDVTHMSLDYDKHFSLDKQHQFRGLFYGLGSDGTVSANKNSIKIIGDTTRKYVQGYFVYDSKKSGSLTVSHLRFGDKPIESTYLVQSANFIACHQFNYLEKFDVLENAEEGAVFLLNAPYSKDEVWSHIPHKIQNEIISKKIQFYILNASGLASKLGMGKYINTILQTGFFAISNIIPREEAIECIKDAIRETYGKKGEQAVNKNIEMVDRATAELYKIDYSGYILGKDDAVQTLPIGAPEFMRNVLSKIISGKGDELPVSAFPVDGTFPSATTQWEKRNIGDIVPVWDTDSCSQCGKCFLVCPHAAIRCKVYDKAALANAPETFKTAAPIGKEFSKDDERYTLQISLMDCTGCRLCYEVCPIESKTQKGVKAINMVDKLLLEESENKNWDFFLTLPDIDRSRVNRTQVKGSQLLEPLFEFSGACSGCGETSYLKLLSQLFGDRMLIANATGCSSIFGGNLPTTPWAVNHEGHGPAWANSLFEDNAEFGLGIKLAVDQKREVAFTLLKTLYNEVGAELADSVLNATSNSEKDLAILRSKMTELRAKLLQINSKESKLLLTFFEYLLPKSVWIIGGDGWAYDIGYGGLDHVLSTGRNVNIFVLDTEVYSNTGGQASKSSPRGASAKFAINGKRAAKKDLGWQAIAHGNVYVAQIAMGANDSHTVKTILEAEAFNGPSLIIAYSHCIAHGYDMAFGMKHQSNAVKSGYWPIFRYNPAKEKGQRFSLDCAEPTLSLGDFEYSENRFKLVKNKDPKVAESFLHEAEEDMKMKWQRIAAMKTL